MIIFFALGIILFAFLDIVFIYETIALISKFTPWKIPTVSQLIQRWAKMNLALAIAIEATLFALLFLLALHLLGIGIL